MLILEDPSEIGKRRKGKEQKEERNRHIQHA